MFRTRFGGNKYKAVRTEYKGIHYDSKKEAGFALELDWKKVAREIKDWERQVKISLDIGNYHIANYYCDFLVYHNDGTKELIEVKSPFTERMEVYRLKRKLLEAIYLPNNPEVRYTVVS